MLVWIFVISPRSILEGYWKVRISYFQFYLLCKLLGRIMASFGNHFVSGI